jgi:hypothetical protein
MSFMLSVIYAECHYAECLYVEYLYADSRGALLGAGGGWIPTWGQSYKTFYVRNLRIFVIS